MRGTIKKFFWQVCLCFLFSPAWTVSSVLAEIEKTEILIGSHLPLSGAQAMQAIEQKWAFEKAVEDINKKGGIYVKQYDKKLPVRLVVMDDETDPVKAKLVVEKLINKEKVDFILSGCAGSHGVLQGLITAEKYRKYYHATTVWITEYLKYDFKWSTLYFFDMVRGCAIPFEIWNSLPEDERPKRPAVFMEDSFDGKQMGNLLAALAENFGYTVALQETIALGGKDFTSQIIKAKSMGVDAILLFSNTEETATLVRQMKKVDFSVKFLHGWKGTWAAEFYETVGRDADYIFCDGFWSEDYPFPKAKELGNSYYKRFGKRSVSIGMYYASCQILWQAIEDAGTLDSAKVRQAILDGEFNTVMGKADYDEKGVAVFPLASYQWWNGRQEIVYPFEYSKFRVKTAPPWDKRQEKREEELTRDYILIGHPNPSTGPLAIMGETSPWTNDKAAAVINAQGGIYIKERGKKLPVKIKIVDTESDMVKAVNLAANLILKDKVDLMVVMHTSETVDSVAAVCEKYHVPCISTQAPVEPWLENGPYKWCYHTFWMLDSFMETYLGMWDQYADQTNRVVGGLWPASSDAMKSSEIANNKFPDRGYELINYTGFPNMTTDFSEAIKLFKDKKVDILTGVLVFPDFATFWRQSRQMGFHPKIVTIAKCLFMPVSINMFAAEGLDPKGWTSEIWWGPGYPFKSSLTGQTAKEFSDSWSEDTGKQATMVLGFVHAAFEIAFDALKRAQTLDKEKLRRAIEETDLDTIVGHIKFNDEHYCETPLVGGQWDKGNRWPWELKVIYNKEHPEIPKTGEMFFPLPE